MTTNRCILISFSLLIIGLLLWMMPIYSSPALQPDDHNHHDETAETKVGRKYKKISTSTATSSTTPSIAAGAGKKIKSERKHHKRVVTLELQEQFKFWSSCLEPTGSLQWLSTENTNFNNNNNNNKKKRCKFQFENLLDSKKDDKFLHSILSQIDFKAQGDSTLRELMKFFANRFKMSGGGGGLEKKDANMTMRSPKFFSNAKSKVSLTFRFDFFGEQFLEPLFVVSSSFANNFSSSSSRSRIFFLSVGSHIAKHVIVDLKEKNIDGKWETIIKNRIIVPTRKFLNRETFSRIHHHRDHRHGDERKEDTDDSHAVDNNNNNSNDEDKSDFLVVFALQSVECKTMSESDLPSFRKLALVCKEMQKFIDVANRMIIDEFSVENSKRSEHYNNENFLYIAPLSCVTQPEVRAAVASTSKPRCSRDGIHLRSKFLRLRLDVALNAILRWWRS